MSAKSVIALALLTLVLGCADRPAATEVSAAAAGGRAGGAAAEHPDLVAARAATARFHNFAAAEPAGYDFLFLNMCMEDPAAGGMGYHWVDTTRVDTELDPTRPEALLYEPQANGQLRLVGVEYVVPRDLWTSPEKPRLFGRELQPNGFGLFALHVWLWRD
ncbi:MAG TPA: hypothetical protein VFS40_00330, partial [Gemmatimonadales bacterium]|nr:hypothetical protein [Gemmatimonadales bacterium]